MDLRYSQLENACQSADISSYIDGELSPSRELELELHFSGCESCLAELNLQKKFLIALDHALESEEEIDVPANFTQVVVANAESRVNGLRRPAERFHAFFVCFGLFLVIIFALGSSGSRTAFDALFVVLDKVTAVGSFAAHVAYDIAIGAVIVIRSLASQVVFGSSLTLLFPGLAAVYLFVVSRVMSLVGRG